MKFLAALPLSLMIALPALADRPTKEVLIDRAELHNDKLDLKRIKQLKAQFKRARKSGNPKKINEVDRATIAFLEGELREGAVEKRRDSREIARSRNEAKRSRGLAKVDDRRDLRDDKRDRRVERREQSTTRQLANAFRALQGRYGKDAMQKRGRLYDRMKNLERKEVRSTKKELREDKRERREDRRERRRKK